MNKLFIYVAIALLFGVIGGYAISQRNQFTRESGQSESSYTQRFGEGMRGKGVGKQGEQKFDVKNCVAEDCLLVEDLQYPAGELTEETKNALVTAIQDEYKAHATYEAVIAKFGLVRPFSMIIRSEEQHISALKALFDKYGIEVPADTVTAKAPATLQQACQTGVDAEVANAALYKDELLPSVSNYPDITAVFTNLMNASQEKHLPAFERCN